MQLRIAVCDDDVSESSYLQKLIFRCCQEKAEVSVFHSGHELLTALAEVENLFSMILLDIYIGEEHGLEIAAEIKALYRNIPIVFITSSREYAIEAFSMRVFHYLVKPVTQEEMERLIQLYYMEHSNNERPSLSISQGRDTIQLLQEKIRYLQSQNKVTHIVTEDKDISVSRPLRELESELSSQFVKLQRGIIVNMDFISRMTTDSCELKDGRVLLLSRNTRAWIRKTYKEFIYNKVMRGEES